MDHQSILGRVLTNPNPNYLLTSCVHMDHQSIQHPRMNQPVGGCQCGLIRRLKTAQNNAGPPATIGIYNKL